ncbi:hypothetical protein Brms1b_006800 [Colletotrichum noveboracense]|nr:hypothetical protein CGCF245_v011847 [Colletotrichum fructicola]KAJ0270250.1 hypothetical protein COL940_011823 [Colletotrichum noveboracense]KAJ0275978.1 hypothetical protein CBS470a_011028 [Colletotrichum nupharicola]KAJ0314542.1 hypothetical protein Brms1b_006800 [Colletotrichum noveboracense]
MSRRDEYFDPTNPFDAGTFNQFLSYFGNAQTFDVTSISNARARHIQQMSLLNPTMNVTEAREGTSAGECAFMLAVWGSPDNPVAKRSYFEYFFRNERFPVVLGWSPTDTALTVPTLLQIAQDITDASPAGVPLTFAPKAAS